MNTLRQLGFAYCTNFEKKIGLAYFTNFWKIVCCLSLLSSLSLLVFLPLFFQFPNIAWSSSNFFVYKWKKISTLVFFSLFMVFRLSTSDQRISKYRSIFQNWYSLISLNFKLHAKFHFKKSMVPFWRKMVSRNCSLVLAILEI